MSVPSEAREETKPGSAKRRGSRLLLAVALLAGILAALSIGSLVPEMIAGLLGIPSNAIRLVMKVVAVAVALPVMFYLVERIFLDRASRRK